MSVDQTWKVFDLVLQEYRRELEIAKEAKGFSLQEWYVNAPKQAYLEAKISQFEELLKVHFEEDYFSDTQNSLLTIRPEILEIDFDVIKELHEIYGLHSELQILRFGFEFWRLVLDGLVQEDKIFSSWNRMLGKYYEEVGNAVEKREG